MEFDLTEAGRLLMEHAHHQCLLELDSLTSTLDDKEMMVVFTLFVDYAQRVHGPRAALALNELFNHIPHSQVPVAQRCTQMISATRTTNTAVDTSGDPLTWAPAEIIQWSHDLVSQAFEEVRGK